MQLTLGEQFAAARRRRAESPAGGPETGLVPFPAVVPLDTLRTDPTNDAVYGVIDPTDPGIRELAESIRRFGVKEPLVVTRDGVILSGNRRRVACRVAEVEVVPVRYEDILSTDPRF